MKFVVDTGPLTVFGGTFVVPAIASGPSLGESLTTAFTEQLIVGTGVSVKLEFEFRRERALAVSAGVDHGSVSSASDYNVTDTIH